MRHIKDTHETLSLLQIRLNWSLEKYPLECLLLETGFVHYYGLTISKLCRINKCHFRNGINAYKIDSIDLCVK